MTNYSTLNFVTPPACCGQIVERSYAIDAETEELVMRVRDGSSGETTYMITDLGNVRGAIELQNQAPIVDLDDWRFSDTKAAEKADDEIKTFYVWGHGTSSSNLVRNGVTTEASIAVRATEVAMLDEDDPLRSDDAWCVEVECTEEEIDAETRFDSATAGYSTDGDYQS